MKVKQNTSKILITKIVLALVGIALCSVLSERDLEYIDIFLIVGLSWMYVEYLSLLNKVE